MAIKDSINNTGFDDWLGVCVAQVEQALDTALPADTPPPTRLHQAMRYAALGSGKRIRAALVYAAGEAALGSTPTAAQTVALDHAATAVELIHAYSLVHDDLPCMDDDVLRRGRPTVHVQYDEATAMLVGDALQALAFATLAQAPVAPALALQTTQILAHAAGSLGMVGGQAIDCDSVGQALARAQLEQMHAMKTGALLGASVLLGGIVTGAGSATHQALEAYAAAIGLAFQVADDILDVTASTATLGKTAGKDAAQHKPTYVSLLGLEAAKTLLADLRTQAHAALCPLGAGAQRLAQLADFVVERGR